MPSSAAAEQRGLPIVAWQALLGELMDAGHHVGIAVAGTHGKSTTTALLGHLLIGAGLDPTVEVGGAFTPAACAATTRPRTEAFAASTSDDQPTTRSPRN